MYKLLSPQSFFSFPTDADFPSAVVSSSSMSFCSAHHRPACRARTPVNATLHTRCEDASSNVGPRRLGGKGGKLLSAEGAEEGVLACAKGRGSEVKLAKISDLRVCQLIMSRKTRMRTHSATQSTSRQQWLTRTALKGQAKYENAEGILSFRKRAHQHFRRQTSSFQPFHRPNSTTRSHRRGQPLLHTHTAAPGASATG